MRDNTATMPNEKEKKAAFVAVIGRPSAGKSTLINLLCGERVAIVSPVPQTTRNAIRGIVNREQGQLVLVDTPGIHLSEKKFNCRLTETAVRAAGEADIILYVMDAARPPGPEEEAAAELTAKLFRAGLDSGQTPLIVAVNKMDRDGADFRRAADFLTARFAPPNAVFDQSCVFPLSALKNEGVETLLAALYKTAPAGDPFYPDEYYTDQEMDFRISEVIRGAALPYLRQELPHAVYVEVADRELQSVGTTQFLWVRAFIICERESQKGMIVGKGGAIIKAIGETSRKELNRILDWKVKLDLRVKTSKDWRHKDSVLRKLL
ncbi:GTPase Era [Spirochaetia bacterium]|nr:GTPase Era [Spirochaetia bacterium]